MKFTIGSKTYAVRVNLSEFAALARIDEGSITVASWVPSGELLPTVLGELLKAWNLEYPSAGDAERQTPEYGARVMAILFRQLTAQGGEPALLKMFPAPSSQ